ncbi:MAG: holo-[acyl-carrier-protein] synthase [Tenericutes bacterium HGW-Tenericutes-3]|nr:MAG: holo-[acyl-carrier-protein] synthase [Tenericutes bacterium HGW-Tenericutes-3]
MILGIGIDLVDLMRIKELVNDRFINRILSDDELKVYHDLTSEKTKLSYLGGRFASKEAIFKAIKKGPGKTNYKDFSVLNDENGVPYVKTNFFTHGEIIHISITHTDNQAISYVMIEKV